MIIVLEPLTGNATSIVGIQIDPANLADGKVLEYSSSEGKIVWGTVSTPTLDQVLTAGSTSTHSLSTGTLSLPIINGSGSNPLQINGSNGIILAGGSGLSPGVQTSSGNILDDGLGNVTITGSLQVDTIFKALDGVTFGDNSVQTTAATAGLSGYSGYSGKSGYSGTNGLAGSAGINGASGYSGYSGLSGYSGKSGYSGTNGLAGSAGINGASGYSGYSGLSGYSGYSGSGISGYSGTSGYSGISGYSGYSGATPSLSGYLPLSGGTLTGQLNGESGNTFDDGLGNMVVGNTLQVGGQIEGTGGQVFSGGFSASGGCALVGGATVSGGNFTLSARNFVTDTTTGTKIGTATTQKLGFWNATPVVQITTGVASATVVANTGTTVVQGTTYDGYTIQQVVKALRNLGILA